MSDVAQVVVAFGVVRVGPRCNAAMRAIHPNWAEVFIDHRLRGDREDRARVAAKALYERIERAAEIAFTAGLDLTSFDE